MAAEVAQTEETDNHLPEAKSSDNIHGNGNGVGIAASDISSLLDQFLEYEQDEAVGKAKASSVSLTPVSSPSSKSSSTFSMPDFSISTTENIPTSMGLTPPVSPPSSNIISPNPIPASTPVTIDKTENNNQSSLPTGAQKCCAIGNSNGYNSAYSSDIRHASQNNSAKSFESKDIALNCPTSTNNVVSKMILTSQVQKKQPIGTINQTDDIENMDTSPGSVLSSCSSESCIIEKEETVSCDCPTLVQNSVTTGKEEKKSRYRIPKLKERPLSPQSPSDRPTCAVAIKSSLPPDNLIDRRNEYIKWSRNFLDTSDEESDKDARFNPRKIESVAAGKEDFHKRECSKSVAVGKEYVHKRERSQGVAAGKEESHKKECSQSVTVGKEDVHKRERSQSITVRKEDFHKRERSPDPYASSDSEDERDRIRWKIQNERSLKEEQRQQRERSLSRERSRSREVSSSRDSTRSEWGRKRRRSRSNESRRSDSNKPSGVFDEEQERKKIFRVDSSFRKASREERRIVYIGRISNDTIKDDVWRRFRKYGPIEKVTMHFRDEGDNYAFVTFVESASALEAVEDANSDPKQPVLDICFGGRRKFCGGSYVDFDSNTSKLEEKQMNEGITPSQSTGELDFDALLRMSLKKTRRK